MPRIPAEAQRRAVRNVQIDSRFQVNSASKKYARWDKDTSSTGFRAGRDCFADRVGREQRSIAVGAIFCHIELAIRELGRPDAGANGCFGIVVRAASNQRGSSGKKRSTIHEERSYFSGIRVV